MSWKKCNPNLIGKVIYPFNVPINNGLKLHLGDTVIIISKNEDWYYGYSILKSTSGSCPGIFPCSYIKIFGKEENSSNDDSKSGDISIDTLKSKMLNAVVVQTTLWVSRMSALIEENNIEKFTEVESHMNNLLEMCYEVANWSHNKEKLLKLQNQLWVWINTINNLLNFDMTVKTKNYSMLLIANFPLTHLEKMHKENDVTNNDQRNNNEGNKLETNNLTNIQVTVENLEFQGCVDEIVLQWSIIDGVHELHYEHFWQPIKEVRKGRPLWMGEKFLFKDLPTEIKKETVYIVVYVYRMGQLLTESNKQLTEKFRRPISFGSYNLKEMTSDIEKVTINLYNLNEPDFLKPVKETLRTKLPMPTQSRFLQITITLYSQINLGLEGLDANHVLESLLLRNDIPYEGDRHSLYIRLEGAEFDRANKKSAKNVEAEISIKSLNGSKQSCINSNLDEKNEEIYLSSVTYHCNSPKWKDLVKVNLSKITPLDCHILINFYHCTTKDKKGEERKHFGSCFLQLSDFFDSESTFKSYTLNTQKISTAPKKYLKSQMSISQDQERNSLKEFCKITLILCSTNLSKKKEINEFLLQMETGNISISDLRLCLKDIQLITDEDFLKPKLRKNLINMITSFILSRNSMITETIEIELFITWQIITNKFIKFDLKEELFDHLRGKFQFNDFLLRGVQYVMRDSITLTISFDLLAIVMGSMEPVFMNLQSFADQEYQYQISERIKEILRWSLYFFRGQYSADPSKDIRKTIFDCTIDNLKFFQHLTSIDVLLEYFNDLFLSPDFLNEKILPNEKLEFIDNLLKSGIDSDCTDILFAWFNPTIDLCSKLIDHSNPFSLQATEILLDLFCEVKELLQEERIHLFSQKQMYSFFMQLFSVFLSKHFREQQKLKYLVRQESEDPLATFKAYSSNTEILVSQECQKIYTLIFSFLEEWQEINNYDINLNELCVILNNIKILLETNVYSKRWISMYLKISSICSGILEKAADYLQNKNEEVFNKLVPLFFEACFSFLMQSCLQLQNFSLPKRQKILDEYGDMRIDVLEYFLEVWKIKPTNLGNFDKSFTVQSTMKVLKISFFKVPEIRRKMISLLIYSITTWLDNCSTIDEVLHDLISETESLLRNGHGDDLYFDSFQSLEKTGTIPDDVLTVIKSFTKLINLHLEYRKVCQPNSNALHLQFLLHAFMKFYQEEVKILVHFQHYSNKFSQILEAEEQYLEAALILKQQYDLTSWSALEMSCDTIFFENYEGTVTVQQKEQLNKKIIDLLNQAKEFEYAADLCKEEYKHYLKSFKYKELSPLLKLWATYYEKIMTEPRLTLNYYRVTFVGGILPSYMKPHRDYIVKGSMWFKINNVKEMLQNAFPDSIIQFYQSTPPVESPYEQKMVIYLAKMDSLPSETDFCKNRKISTKIRNFYKDHHIYKFTSDHPFHKGTVDKDNEIKTLNICRVTVWTEITMPNLFMWNPIVHEERKCLAPIEVAIDAVIKKNQIFRDTIDEFEEDSYRDLRPFTMLLTGTLDAGVNGGMAKYIEAFFNESNEEEAMADMEHINCFREVLIEQKNVLCEALALHKKLIPQQIQPMQERLEQCFNFLTRTVNDLTIFRKRSFSKMNTLDDVYARMQSFMSKDTSETGFESPSLERQNSRLSESLFNFHGEDANRSSAETTSSCTPTSLRQSNPGMDRINVRNKPDAKIIQRRKVSSTDEEIITKLANMHVFQNSDFPNVHIAPSISSPEIQQPSTSSSLEDMKVSPIKSPPLPPGNSDNNFQSGKPKHKRNWTLKNLNFRSKFRESSSGNQGNNTLKLSLDSKARPKLQDHDLLQSVEADE